MSDQFYFRLPVEVPTGDVSPTIAHTAKHLSIVLGLPIDSTAVDLIVGPVDQQKASTVLQNGFQDNVDGVLEDLRNGPNAVQVRSLGRPVLYRVIPSGE